MKDINRKLRSITKYNRQIKNIISRFLKINKVIEHLNNNVNQLDQLTNYCQYSTQRTLFTKTAECTLFSNVDRTFIKIEHMLSQKASLNKFQSIEIIQYMFHSGIKIEVSKRKT